MRTWRWIKRVFVFLLTTLLLVGFLRYQGVQYTFYRLYGPSNASVDTGRFPMDAQCGGVSNCRTAPMRVVSYNILNGTAWLEEETQKDGYALWTERLPHIRDMLAHYDPDLVGLQEMYFKEDMDALYPPDSGYAQVSARWGDGYYADAALVFRTERFELLDEGRFWLNPTHPELAFGYGWQWASVFRYVNWVVLRERESGVVFLFVNTHFDNNGPNKEASAPLFATVFGGYAKTLPVLAVGDFNTNATTQRYRNLIGAGGSGGPVFANTWEIAEAREHRMRYDADPSPWDQAVEVARPEALIDHVFVAGPAEAVVARWIKDEGLLDEGRPVSDHPMIYAEVSFSFVEGADSDPVAEAIGAKGGVVGSAGEGATSESL